MIVEVSGPLPRSLLREAVARCQAERGSDPSTRFDIGGAMQDDSFAPGLEALESILTLVTSAAVLADTAIRLLDRRRQSGVAEESLRSEMEEVARQTADARDVRVRVSGLSHATGADVVVEYSVGSAVRILGIDVALTVSDDLTSARLQLGPVKRGEI